MIAPLLPGAVETVFADWTLPDKEAYPIYVTVDLPADGQPGLVNECDENNNVSQPITVRCFTIG